VDLETYFVLVDNVSGRGVNAGRSAGSTKSELTDAASPGKGARERHTLEMHLSFKRGYLRKHPRSGALSRELAQALYEASDPNGVPWNKRGQAVRDP
jgi:hypothetical protein